MGKPIWSMWARNCGLVSGFCYFSGGALTLMYVIPWIGIYAIIVGFIMMLVEFPVKPLLALGFKNYLFRGILYLISAPIGFMMVGTTTGALGIIVTGLIYLLAYYCGEEYQHPSEWLSKPKIMKSSVRMSQKVIYQHPDHTGTETRPRILVKQNSGYQEPVSEPQQQSNILSQYMSPPPSTLNKNQTLLPLHNQQGPYFDF